MRGAGPGSLCCAQSKLWVLLEDGVKLLTTSKGFMKLAAQLLFGELLAEGF